MIEEAIELKGQHNRASETEKLLSGISPSDALILLDERGKSPTSRDISAHFDRLRHDGIANCYILIGGADGFDPQTVSALRSGQLTKWSFGHQTWPHKNGPRHGGRTNLPRALYFGGDPVSPRLMGLE